MFQIYYITCTRKVLGVENNAGNILIIFFLNAKTFTDLSYFFLSVARYIFEILLTLISKLHSVSFLFRRIPHNKH